MEVIHIDGVEVAAHLHEQLKAQQDEIEHLRSVNRALQACHAELQLAVREIARSFCGMHESDGPVMTLTHRLRHQARETRS